MHAGPLKSVHPPLRIGKDTYLIRSLLGEGGPFQLYVNSLVIAGREPVIIDTGLSGDRARWWEDAFGIVEPKDVRWVFLSHDDHDHTGNLVEVLEACPNATLVSSWLAVERLKGTYDIPPQRMRWVNDADGVDVGDRTLVVARPPLYDSPATHGLFDSRTGIYWSSDCFGTPVERPIDDAGDIPLDAFFEGFTLFHHGLSPWSTLVQPDVLANATDRVSSLGIASIASAHGPVLHGARALEALRLVSEVPTAPVTPLPGQADLDALIESLQVAGA